MHFYLFFMVGVMKRYVYFMSEFVTKLIDSKINLINQNRENTKNDLVAVNMNNTSTTQIKTNSGRTT
jgi:hypothetical protein